jgi:hypothetical protein
MYVALYVLCGYYIYRREPLIIEDLGRLATLLALVALTVLLITIISYYELRAELIPLMLFGMTLAIAYQQEIALLLSAAVTLVSVVALGHTLADAIVLLAAAAAANCSRSDSWPPASPRSLPSVLEASRANRFG